MREDQIRDETGVAQFHRGVVAGLGAGDFGVEIDQPGMRVLPFPVRQLT
jgi:hypothetical protein